MSDFNLDTLPLNEKTAQQGILGLLLLIGSFNTQTAFIEGLNHTFFPDFNYRLAYKQLCEEIKKEKRTTLEDFLTIYKGDLTEQDFLDSISVLNVYKVEECVDTLYECYKKASLKENVAKALANSNFENPDSVVRELSEVVANYSSKIVPKKTSFLHEFANKYEFDSLEPGIPITHSETLNMAFGGWQKGVYLIGAKSGLGKTSYSVQASLDVAQQGYNVLYLQLEVTERMIFNKFLANITDIPPQMWANMFDKKMPDGTIIPAKEYAQSKGFNADIDALRRRYQEAKKVFADLPIKLSDQITSDSDIEKCITDHFYKGMLDFVVIDYIGLVESGNPRDPEWQRIADFTTKITKLTIKYNFTALLVVQFTKGNSDKYHKATDDDEISMESISGGSAIYKNATGIMILTQDSRMVAREKDPTADAMEQMKRAANSFCKMSIVKNRLESFGGNIYMSYKKPLSKFKEIPKYQVDQVLLPFQSKSK
jgi:replicative DNA helicase